VVRLSHLVSALSGARLEGPDVDVLDITHDSRQVAPGTLFVAVPRVGGDSESGGARFLQAVAQTGAAAVLTESKQILEGISVVRVPNARAALADVSAAFFGHPSRHLRLFAVTGTDGKTTTTYLLEQIFAHAGYCTGTIGTVETKVGEDRTRNADRMTTPESIDVQRILRRMVDAGVTHAVIEASSHALELKRLRTCRVEACGLTNITVDHVEFHGSWEAYFAAKASLFTEVGQGRPAVLNRDDPSFERLSALVSGPVTSYSSESEADVRALDVQPTAEGSRFLLTLCGRSATVELALPGAYNVANALAAAGLAACAGLDADCVGVGLSRASAPPGRLQRVVSDLPFDVLIDYAHTMNAFQSVLSTVRERTPGRVIVVFGATGDRDRAKRPEFARVAARYADLAIITNEDPFGEDPEAIIDEVLSGAPREVNGTRFLRESDRGRAIERAIGMARSRDTVLILGKGHEQSIVVGGHKEPWSDLAAATRALESLP
jgi:UDP-N-acetylmuramoyl-L-alanyl-D-glutamate--2,6-diaminopimelate ligase